MGLNIENKLREERVKQLGSKQIINWVNTILIEFDDKRKRTLGALKGSFDSTSVNQFDLELLDAERIYHKSHIQSLCINYRLKFLDSGFFKGDYPVEAISKIKALERAHKTKIKGFKIAAPPSLFKLKNADDPMLFMPLGNDYFYLIHKWGNDLHPLRKVKYWAIKNIENALWAIVLISAFFTLISHSFFFNGHSTAIYIIGLFMFFFKGFVGWGVFYGVASGLNLSEYTWDSEYDKPH